MDLLPPLPHTTLKDLLHKDKIKLVFLKLLQPLSLDPNADLHLTLAKAGNNLY